MGDRDLTSHQTHFSSKSKHFWEESHSSHTPWRMWNGKVCCFLMLHVSLWHDSACKLFFLFLSSLLGHPSLKVCQCCSQQADIVTMVLPMHSDGKGLFATLRGGFSKQIVRQAQKRHGDCCPKVWREAQSVPNVPVFPPSLGMHGRCADLLLADSWADCLSLSSPSLLLSLILFLSWLVADPRERQTINDDDDDAPTSLLFDSHCSLSHFPRPLHFLRFSWPASSTTVHRNGLSCGLSDKSGRDQFRGAFGWSQPCADSNCNDAEPILD